MDVLHQQLFDQANQMREAKGLTKFTYDDRLEKAAQKHADDLGAGRARPHDHLQWRIYTYGGFPKQDCHMSRPAMAANYSEGIINLSAGMDLDKALPYLVGGGPGEGHHDDFYDPKATHVGIGIKQQGNITVCVLDYGIICDFKPEPEMMGRDKFDLW